MEQSIATERDFVSSITEYNNTIIEYDICKKQRLKRRLYYEPRCMEMRKMCDL